MEIRLFACNVRGGLCLKEYLPVTTEDGDNVTALTDTSGPVLMNLFG